MSAIRLAALSIVVTLFYCPQQTSRAGDGLPPVPGYVVVPAQKVEPLTAQKFEIPPAQKYEVLPVQKQLAVQKHVVQKHVTPLPMKGGCCEPKIIYRHHRCCKRRDCCSCESCCQVILPVADPDCCEKLHYISVPAPPSCQGVPWEKDRPGLFCRGVSIFKWPGGYMVKVVFLKKGDIIVHTFGVPVPPPVVPVAFPSQPYPAQPYPVAPSVYSPAPTPALPPEETGPELVPPGGYAF